MANYTGPVVGTFEHKDIEYQIHDTEEFENESFGWTIESQPFPTDHYEVRPFQIVGPIASGKTTLAERYYGNRIKQLWGDNVDFTFIEDIYAACEAVKNSDKLVHYMILDDMVSKLDSRKSMENADATEMFYEIRHELKKFAKENEGNAGGLVFIAMLTQDYYAIDKRLRNSIMFTVFKAYDPACEKKIHGRKMIEDPEIIDLLTDMKDESLRKSNYEYRKLGVGVDAKSNYCLFYAERNALPKIEFRYVNAEDRIETQKGALVYHLLKLPDVAELSRSSQRAELYFKLDQMKQQGERIRVNKTDFSEIIDRANRVVEIFDISNEKVDKVSESEKRKKKDKQKAILVDFLTELPDLLDINKSSIKGELYFKLDEMEQNQKVYVDSSDFSEIADKAIRIREREENRRKISKAEKRQIIAKQKEILVKHLASLPDLLDLTKSSLRAELYFKIDEISGEGEGEVYIDKTNFTELIDKAKRKKEIELKELKESKAESKSKEGTGPSELILHDTLGKSFSEIAEIKGIAQSTAHRRYTKQKEKQAQKLLQTKKRIKTSG